MDNKYKQRLAESRSKKVPTTVFRENIKDDVKEKERVTRRR